MFKRYFPEYTPEYRAALKTANEVREKLGKPPVDHLYPGEVGKARSCPITNTIYDDDIDRKDWEISTYPTGIVVEKLTGGADYWRRYDPTKEIRVRPTPKATKFVNEFDKGNFPTLDVRKKKA